MDLFADKKLLFNTQKGQLSVLPSGTALTGFISHKGETRSNGLLAVPIALNGVKVNALIDTGAAATIAPPAVLKALGWKKNDPHLKEGGEIKGATKNATRIREAIIDTLTLGPVNFRNIPLRFTDSPISRGIGQSDEAVVILGADLLDYLQAYALDFPKGELQILMPPPKKKD